MTTDRAFKRAVRERMAQTGEKYTVARRALAGDDGGSRREDPITAALRPCRMTGFVSGGGMTTLGLVLPHLLRLEDEGHHLTIAPHISGQRGHPMSELPSLLDQVTARGLATPQRMAEDLAGELTLLRQLAERMPGSSLLPGATRDSRLSNHLRENERDGRTAVIWVQDVQTDPPLTRGGDGGFDGIEAQLDGLRRIARETGAIVVVGHCMPPEYEDGWEVLRAGADDTFVIADDTRLAATDDHIDSAVIEHHAADQPAYRFEREIDLRFGTWRYLYSELRGWSSRS
jgi:hypothetical protein